MSSPFPVFDPATPKVSTLSIGMGVLESAIELVNEAEQQTAKFQPKASDKAGFMLTNYELPNPNPGMVSSPYPSLTQRALTWRLMPYAPSHMKVAKCTLANATGVRLEFIEEGSKGLVQEYKPPTILEPGEVASFLVDKSVFELKYNIQTFQGPTSFGPAGQAGWVRGDADKTVTVEGKDSFQTSIDAVVQVDQTTMYPTQFKFAVSRNGDAWQIRATQSITGYSLTGKAAVLGSGDSILLGRTGDLGFSGGESWTIELWVKVDSIKPGGPNDSDQAVFGINDFGPRQGHTCVFRNGGRLHIDPYLPDAEAADDPTPIEVNVWTHFALQFEKAPPLTPDPANAAGDLRIFRNGVLVATNRSPPAIGNVELRLGQYASGRPLLGSLAQVRLWNVAVPANEIKARLYT
jgi:hypothetical protein